MNPRRVAVTAPGGQCDPPQQTRKAYNQQGQNMQLQQALGQLLGTNDPWNIGIRHQYAYDMTPEITVTSGTTGQAGFSPITYTTTTTPSSTSYSTTGALYSKGQ